MESTCIRHVADAQEKELLLGTLIRLAPLPDNKRQRRPEAPRHLYDRATSSPTSPGDCSS